MSETIKQDIKVTFDKTPFTFYKHDRIYGYMIANLETETIFNNLYYYKVFNLSVKLTCHQRDMYEKKRRYSLIPYGQGEAGFTFTKRYIDVSFYESVDVVTQFNIEIESTDYFKEVSAFQPIGFLLFEEGQDLPNNVVDSILKDKERLLKESGEPMIAEVPSEISLELIVA